VVQSFSDLAPAYKKTVLESLYNRQTHKRVLVLLTICLEQPRQAAVVYKYQQAYPLPRVLAASMLSLALLSVLATMCK
jgi:hypothetical protein